MGENVDASVTSVSPFRILLDTDTEPYPFAPDTLIDPLSLTIGDRVRCETGSNRVVVLGKAGGVEVPPFIETRTVTYTTSSLANNASETVELDFGVGFTLLHFESSHAIRVRAYQSVAHRTADASRAVRVLPSGDHGLIFEDDGSAVSDYATVAVGGLLSGETLCPIAVTNRSGSTRTIDLVFTVRS